MISLFRNLHANNLSIPIHVIKPNIFFRNFSYKNTSLISRLISPRLHPYIELSRLDKPIGTWLLYIPCTWGVALASPVGTLPDVSLLAMLGAGAIFMRGAGCTINDMHDRELDANVERTCMRPLARESITFFNAFVFLGLQLTGALYILLQLNNPSICLGISSLPLVLIYPFCKRYTHWPQLILGFAFNWGTFLGFTAVSGHCPFNICVPLYISGIMWTLIYDTVYAHQDIRDDVRLGFKSTAILFNDKTKKWLSFFVLCMSGCLTTVGVNSDANLIYYMGAAVTMLYLCYGLHKTNLNDSESCLKFFKLNRNYGLMIFASITLDKLLRLNPMF